MQDLLDHLCFEDIFRDDLEEQRKGGLTIM